ALGSFSAYSKSSVEPVATLNGKDAVITGTICEQPYKAYGHTYYVLEINDIALKNAPHVQKIRLSTQSALNVDVYGTVHGKVHFFLPTGGTGYSSRTYYASKGITAFVYLYQYEDVTLTPPKGHPLYYYALKARGLMIDSVRNLLPQQEADLVNGVLLGDTGSLSDEVQSDFRTIGISHILSVSGLHMATMAQFFLLLLAFIKVPKRYAAAFAAVGVFCFMAVTGFVPSVMRSGIMYLIYLAGMIVGRRADSLNSLGIAVLILCVINPYAAADVGLLLSFAATLGLIMLSQPLNDWMKAKYAPIRHGRALISSTCATLSTTAGAVVATLPIIVLSFGTVSLVAPLANILELVPSSFMMEFAAVSALLNFIPPLSFLAKPFALLTGLLAKYMQSCAHWLAQIPFASISASYGFVKVWLAATLLLIGITVLLMKRKRLLKVTAVLSAILLLCGILSYQLSMRNVARLAVLDVGTGTSVVLIKDGHAALIGCGGFSPNTTAAYLRSLGVQKLDYMQLTGSSTDEFTNAAQLIDTFHPINLIVQKGSTDYGSFQKSLTNADHITYYESKAVSQLWGNVTVTIDDTAMQNITCLQIGQTKTLICPSNCDAGKIPSQWRRPDFVVLNTLPQHASRLHPLCTVLSMDAETLQANIVSAQKAGVATYATAGAGNLSADIQNDRQIKLRRES
ncbi:MAG TPA: ComEC/Rec2 family competence protein, partial [Oscillospiraceae bacterium]|nr:ComEC/Rec2 family competence protein [Oscillospiraceae bacterium]